MTYRNRYGKFEIRMDGCCYKWYKSLENATAEFERLARYPDELDGDMELVDMNTGKVLRSVDAE